MDFEKKNNIYKTIMIILVTALVASVITAVAMYNYYTNTSDGIAKALTITKTTDLDTKISLVRKYLEKEYLWDIPEDESTLNESAVKGYVDGLGDEYTEYLTKDEYESLITTVNGNYVGIGIYMAQDKYGNIVVLLPIKDSPAEEAGLKTGDIISKIDGEDCLDIETSVAANKIKGEEGTTVELEIIRDEETFVKTIERRTVQINPINVEVLDNNIGYIQITAFDDDSSKEFKEKLNELLSKNIKSLIIDVRDNGGGIVDEAINIAELFLPKDKTIMIKRNKTREKEIKSSEDSKIDNKLKIVILANGNSASASEILIGALRDNGIAKVVGEKTFGKGVMQEVLKVESGGALKITIEEFKTPNGDVINKKGIKPDIEIENDKETEEDEQLQKAIEECKK